VAIDWSILRENAPVDIAGNFTRGYEIGSKIVDHLHQSNALAALSGNPDDQGALAALYRVNPEAAIRMETMNMKRHDAHREDDARGALADFITSRDGLAQPVGLTGVRPNAGPAMPATASAPAAEAPAASQAPADPLAPLPDAPAASEAPITITAPRTSAIPMSDSWAHYVHNDPEGAMKFLINRAKLGSDHAKALTDQMGLIGQLANGVTDQASYDAALAQAKEHGFDVSHLPTEYTPAVVQSIQKQAQTAQQYLTLEHNVADDNTDNAETERHHTADEENTRRGQNMSSTDRRRGQDMGSETTRRGQDISSSDRQLGQDYTHLDRMRGQLLTHGDRLRGQDMKGKGSSSGRPAIIVNPKTGKKMKLVNGQWVDA
jgi:hypothetical protein